MKTSEAEQPMPERLKVIRSERLCKRCATMAQRSGAAPGWGDPAATTSGAGSVEALHTSSKRGLQIDIVVHSQH
jgi:hypothetical protein